MRKRSTGFVALALSAGLLLGACSSGNPEDPQSALKENSVTASKSGNAETDAIISGGEEIEIADELLSSEELEDIHANRSEEELSEEEKAAQAQAESDYAEVESQEVDAGDKNFGFDFESSHFGVDVSQIKIPEEVKNSFPDHNVSQAPANALEALEWASVNGGVHRRDVSEYDVRAYSEYMSGYLSENGKTIFQESLAGERDPLLAWTLMPYYSSDFSLGGVSYDINQRGHWNTGIGNIKVLEGMYVETGQPTGGVTVEVPRTIYIPLASGETLVFNYGMFLSMVPGDSSDKSEWVIDDIQYQIGKKAEVVRGGNVS